MKIAIAGATSMIGKHLTQKALDLGWEIVAVLRPNRRGSYDNTDVQQVFLNMEDYNQLGKITGPCDCFVDLAWEGTRGSSRMDAQLQQKNLEYSIDAVRSILHAGCKKVITAGSQAEYGPHAEVITEQTPCIPNTEYGKAKLAFYETANSLCQESNAVCIEPRFFSLYGPDDYEGTLIISTLKHMLSNQPCRLTQGIQMWDYLYIDDAITALSSLCEKDCPSGVYNFGSGDIRMLRDYIKEMAVVTKSKSELLFGSIPYPETGMVSLWPDSNKLKNTINWSPVITFAEGLHRMIAALNSDLKERS